MERGSEEGGWVREEREEEGDMGDCRGGRGWVEREVEEDEKRNEMGCVWEKEEEGIAGWEWRSGEMRRGGGGGREV